MNRTAFRRTAVRSLLAAAALVWIAQLPELAHAQAAAQDCITNTTPTGADARTFTGPGCGGLEVRLVVPDQCATQSCALSVQLNGVTVRNVVTNLNDGLEDIGRKEGFITLRAQGPISPGLNAPSLRQDDVPRIIGIIEEAVKDLKVNPNRVHLGGFSQGAGAALTIVCMRPDLIASAVMLAPAGGAPAACTQNGPMAPLMFAQSSKDQLVNPQRTAGTVQAFVTGMGLTMADAKILERGEQNIMIREFRNAKGQVLDFLTSDLGGAFFGDGHCFYGSFEPPTPPGTMDNPKFGCTDMDMIRFGQKSIEFFIANQKPAGRMN